MRSFDPRREGGSALFVSMMLLVLLGGGWFARNWARSESGKAKLDELKDKAGKVRSPEACNLYKINMLSTRAALHWFLPMGHTGGS